MLSRLCVWRTNHSPDSLRLIPTHNTHASSYLRMGRAVGFQSPVTDPVVMPSSSALINTLGCKPAPTVMPSRQS